MKHISVESGNAMLEFALMMPLLVFMMMAVVDYAIIIQRSIILIDAASNATKFAVTPGNGSNLTGMQSAAASAAAGVPGFTAVATNFCSCSPGGAATSCTTTCSSYVNPVEYARVTTSATVHLLFGVSGLSTSYPVSTTSTVRIMWLGH